MIYLQAASALALVLGLVGLFYYVALRLSGRVSGGVTKRRIHVLERTSLGDKRSLMIVSVGREQYLLGATSHAISMLSQIPDEASSEEPETETERPGGQAGRISFRKMLEAIR